MSDLAERLNSALATRYKIEAVLGTGGMATVFLAQDLRHRRKVAIKVLHPELAAVLGTDRFLREIEIAAGLSHPHILPLYDSGSADGQLYYVMPYAGGESLRQRLEREKQLPLDDALRIARETADALDYAHRQGVIHRDIKPENILLMEGHAAVADFGIARAVAAAGAGTQTTAGIVMGTPAYMSPEQTAGSRNLDGRSDQYALACVVYEMLAGQPPFNGPTAESLAHQHLSVAPRPVTDLRPTVPEQVSSAVSRALAKTPADRFPGAAQFAAALAAAAAGRPGLAEALDSRKPMAATSPASGGPAPARRMAWRLAALAGAAVAVTAIGLLVVRPGRQARAPAPVAPAHARSEIAVLPFENLSGEGPHAYFARGLHEELLTQLSKVTALKVISRTSVMGYQGTSKPLKTIASELGVGSVVEGSVQVEGERLRVTVQLIDATTDEHLWAERYDRTLNDAFAIQSEVAQAIVAAVGTALTSAEHAQLAAAPTGNAEAYRLYLQGLVYDTRPGLLQSNLKIAQHFYERALALDRNFALAHAALSVVHGRLYWLRYDPSPARAAAQRREAMTALRLAPDLPRAHFAMGMSYYQGRHDYPRALDEFSIAIRGLPNDAELWQLVAAVNRRLGDWNKVIPAFEKAVQLDPRRADLYMVVPGYTYEMMRRYAESVRAFDQALNLAPDLYIAAVSRAWIFVRWQGQLDTLRAALSRVPEDAELGGFGSVAGQRAELLLWDRNPEGLLKMLRTERAGFYRTNYLLLPTALYAAWAYQQRGDQAAARAAFDEALVRSDSALRVGNDDWRPHAARGLVLAGLGHRDQALSEARWLQGTFLYRSDAFEGAFVAEDRARILAQAGEADAAVDELERLMAKPSRVSIHTLRLDPRWDPIRHHPRFEALLAKYSS